jgi:hypothetical protein
VQRGGFCSYIFRRINSPNNFFLCVYSIPTIATHSRMETSEIDILALRDTRGLGTGDVGLVVKRAQGSRSRRATVP